MSKIKVKGQTVQTGERPGTNGRTDTDATKCYAVDNNAAQKLHEASLPQNYKWSAQVFDNVLLHKFCL